MACGVICVSFRKRNAGHCSKKLKKLFLGGRSYDVRASRPHKNVYIIHLAGVEDRNRAEPLVGTPVEIPAAELPKLPEGEYYYFQLIGLTVVSDTGDTVGTLTEIIETGANNVYAVKRRKERKYTFPPYSPASFPFNRRKRR